MIAPPTDQLQVMSTYLAANFPEREYPEAVVLARPAEVTLTEWMAPTLGSWPSETRSGRANRVCATTHWCGATPMAIASRPG